MSTHSYPNACSTDTLQETLSGGASLLCTRLTAWFRLTWGLGSSQALLMQLKALHLFLSAAVESGGGVVPDVSASASSAGLLSSTDRLLLPPSASSAPNANSASTSGNFLSEFIASGGIPTLLSCLQLPSAPPPPTASSASASPPPPSSSPLISDGARRGALQLLHVLARASRATKELMCAQNGVKCVVQVLCAAASSLQTLEEAKLLLITLGTVRQPPSLCNIY